MRLIRNNVDLFPLTMYAGHKVLVFETVYSEVSLLFSSTFEHLPVTTNTTSTRASVIWNIVIMGL